MSNVFVSLSWIMYRFISHVYVSVSINADNKSLLYDSLCRVLKRCYFLYANCKLSSFYQEMLIRFFYLNGFAYFHKLFKTKNETKQKKFKKKPEFRIICAHQLLNTLVIVSCSCQISIFYINNNTFDFMLLLNEPGYYVVEDVAKQQKRS